MTYVPGLDEKRIRALCDVDEYSNKSNYPFINFYPFTQPSQEYVDFVTSLLPFKESWKISVPIEELRDSCNTYFHATAPLFKDTSVKKLIVDCDGLKVANFEVSYAGSSRNNGVVIEAHGGGYCLVEAAMRIQHAEWLSKFTGCVVISLDYQRAPESPLPNAVNELLALYRFVLNSYKVAPSKIAMIGGSAGGGMILLAIQQLARRQRTNSKDALPQPCCAILNAAWGNLALDSNSYRTCVETDMCMDFQVLDALAGWAVGNWDASGKKRIANNDRKSEIYSPVFGSFEGVTSALYFTVGAAEMLFDDSIRCAQKAYDAGVDVRCDIEPFMLHNWATLCCNVCPEYITANARIADWILQHFQTNKAKSKL